MFHVKHCSDCEQELLKKYVSLLLKWNKRLNLVGRSTEKDVWERHITDSGQFSLRLPNKESSICDLGSGAGLPGVVLSILGYKNLSLIEADLKKSVFLKEVRRTLNLDYKILTSRAEDVKDLQYDVIVSRAMASIETLFRLTKNIRNPDSKMIISKGKTYKEEVQLAEKKWNFLTKIYPSQTSLDGVLIVLDKINER